MTSASTVALRDQILAVLEASAGFPVSTADVAERCGHAWSGGFYHTKVYQQLHALERRGLVTRLRMEGWRQVWWSVPPKNREAT